MMVIEKGEEILTSYRNNDKFRFGSREVRRQELLVEVAFLSQCSECSLEGWDLEDNEKMREELGEKKDETKQLLLCEGPDPVPRKDMKRAMKLAQQTVRLIQKLNIRAEFVREMICFYRAAIWARTMGVTCQNDPEVFKREALKYAKMFGDNYIYYVNKETN